MEISGATFKKEVVLFDFLGKSSEFRFE